MEKKEFLFYIKVVISLPLFARNNGMNTRAVRKGATRLCRSMDSQAELSCFSMIPGSANPPVCTTAQRPAKKKKINYMLKVFL